MKRKLGILCSHPIQYYSPLFRHLANTTDIDLKVYYCHKPSPDQQGTGFGVAFSWDVDLTGGYENIWLKNVARQPNLVDFGGCDTPEIAEIIRRDEFNAFLILGWDKKSMWQAIRACWKYDTPLLVRGDSHLHVQIPFYKKLGKELSHRYFIPKFSACLAVGQWSKEYFEHYGAKNIFMSPHFVDNEWFAKELLRWKPLSDKIKKEWKISLGTIVFLFVGKFEEKKRPMDILWALKRILKKNRTMLERLRVLMVGDGVLKKGCEKFALLNSLPVTFTGFLNQSQISKAYSVSDVLVLPSDGRETWGLVVNEAMACGLPAIVTDQVGCGPDLIKWGRTGFIFRCGDTKDLADKMELFLVNGGSEINQENIEHHIAHYSMENAAEGIFKTLGAA